MTLTKGYLVLYYNKNKTFFKLAYSPTLDKKEKKYNLEYWHHFESNDMKNDKEMFTKMFNKKYQKQYHENYINKYIVYKMKPEYYNIDDPNNGDGPLVDMYEYYEEQCILNEEREDIEYDEIEICRKKLLQAIHNTQKKEMAKFTLMKNNILNF